MKEETIEGFAKYRLEKAKDALKSAQLLYKTNDLTGAINRAYYAIFYAIRAVLSLERIDFKRHKDVLAYFNKKYVSTEIFPKQIGKKISQAQRAREDSDYDDEYEQSFEKTEEQIKTAEEIIRLVEKYMDK